MKVNIKHGLAGSKEMNYMHCAFHVPEYVEGTNDMVNGYHVMEIVFGYTSNQNAFFICDKCWQELSEKIQLIIDSNDGEDAYAVTHADRY